jgi:plastocyanin
MPRIALVGLSVLVTLGACGADDTDTTAALTTTSALSALPAATAPSAQPSGAGAVAIAEFAFMPSPVTVSPGGTVTWTNNDEAPHSVSDASPMGTPKSKSLNKGDTFSITYSKPGTYPYVCGIHNYMQGSVEVKG